MKFKILITIFSLTVSSHIFAAGVVWFDGKTAVSYNVIGESSPVVGNALRMFAADMFAVTGRTAISKAGGMIEIYELDKLNNKEFKALHKLDLPINSIITKPDAFILKVLNGRIMVVGSNGRGTAYGILELSRLAGVSAWTWWGDVVPDRKLSLVMRDDFASVQFPSVEYRGISITNDDWSIAKLGRNICKNIFELMLRLRGNCLNYTRYDGDNSFYALANEYGITLFDIENDGNNRIAKEKSTHADKPKRKEERLGNVKMWSDDGYGYMQTPLDNREKKHNEATGAYYHLSNQGVPHDYLWLNTTQPGLIYNAMRKVYNSNTRKIWIANVHNPKVAAYDLALFMDMAWDINCVKSNTLQQHLHSWLGEQFGQKAASPLLLAMVEYYRLTDIRKPEFMGWNEISAGKDSVNNSGFNSLEFGNELARYLADYQRLENTVENIQKTIRPELIDAYFAAVKYPVFAAAAMAIKQLEAQESREFTRAGAFHIDAEALTAAVRSMKAYDEIRQLTDYYNNKMTGGKWKGTMDMSPRDLSVFASPALPDKLTSEEMKKYADYSPVESTLKTEGSVAHNASDFDKSRHAVEPIQMLGHSMNAVAIDKNASLSYTFDVENGGDALLYVALIPVCGADGEQLRFSVSVDNNEPMEVEMSANEGSQAWKEGVLRGQMVSKLELNVDKGHHTLTIKALTNNIILDQWLMDFDLNREFYVFPTVSK